MHVYVLNCFSCVWLFEVYEVYPTRLFCPRDSSGKDTRVGFHALFQGITLTQGSNLHLYISCIGRQVLIHLCHLGCPISYTVYIGQSQSANSSHSFTLRRINICSVSKDWALLKGCLNFLCTKRPWWFVAYVHICVHMCKLHMCVCVCVWLD